MRHRLEVEAAAMRCVVPQQAHKQWSGLALDTQTRQSSAVPGGDRSRTRARRLGTQLPAGYRQQATWYTAQSVVYAGVMPAAQHNALHKVARKNPHGERFNHPLRQRVSRRVRET